MPLKKDSMPHLLPKAGCASAPPAGPTSTGPVSSILPAAQKNLHEASLLVQFFDTIEINTSFYQPIRPAHAAWIGRVAANPSFLFATNPWQRFTHEPSASIDDDRNVRAGFEVLHEPGKLGAILLQFPFSFHKSTETIAHLSALLNRFADYPLVVELHHSSSQDQAALELLRERNAGFCNID
jgi:uncharacterized protein YecE (DUF72 family)